MESARSSGTRQLISKFLEIAVGQTEEIAIEFLRATRWDFDEAINLFFIERNYHKPLSYEEIWDSDPGPSNSGSDSRLSSLYRAPLDLTFKGSFEDAKTTSSREDLWLLVNLQCMTDFASHTLNRDLWSNDAVSQAIECSFLLFQVYDHTDQGKKISTFYKIDSAPPVVLLIDPMTGQKMRTWSGVVEAQSFLEDLIKYSDVRPHEHITSLTSKNRIETEKTCFSSNHANQDMATFRGKSAEAKTLFSHKKEETYSSSNNTPLGQEFEDQVVAPSWGPEFEEETCSSSIHSSWDFEFEEPSEVEEEEEDQTYSSSYHTPSWVHEFEETMILHEHEEEACFEEFPVLTEEPKGDCDRSLVCSLCVRFPEGRRKQRKFLKSEPIQLLWSFCDSHMEESEKRAFKLVHAIPGATKTLDYGANVTFGESGLANSMISVTWE